MAGNYPLGVSDSHPHFNPPCCSICGGPLDENMDCQDCGEHHMTREEWEDAEADRAYDQMQEEGRNSI